VLATALVITPSSTGENSMKPDFENFTKELLDEFCKHDRGDVDGSVIESLLENHHIVKEVPSSDEYKAEYGEDAETMFVPNFEEATV
jgi:hypothetical protein